MNLGGSASIDPAAAESLMNQGAMFAANAVPTVAGVTESGVSSLFDQMEGGAAAATAKGKGKENNDR